MSALNKITSNKNLLSPLGFQFSIYKTPNVNYFVQAAAVPSLSIGRVEQGTPFSRLKFPGDKLDFGDLNITFRVDEELRNYYELYNWMIGLGKPENFNQYSDLAAQNAVGKGIVSDATLIILSSAKNPIVEINYRNLYPVSLSEINFNTQLNDVDYVDCIATFAYDTFSIKYLI
jgi:hypothetical protein